jgi:nicotinamide-nucleotide adenylyltransferase
LSGPVIKGRLTRGLFIGRFQPYHLGHKMMIDFALKNTDDLIIVIGSSQSCYEVRNPFTCGERILMIKESLNANKDIDQKRILIIPVPDSNIHYVWTHQVDMMVPKYDCVFSNDPYTVLLFRERNIIVRSKELYRRKYFSSTEIRRRMTKDVKWEHLTSKEAVKVINDIGGVRRMKELIQKVEGIRHP